MSPARTAALAALLAGAAARGAAPPSSAILADVVLDPNVPAIVADEGDLLAHYAAPIVEGDAVYTEVKDGVWTGRDTWETQTWGIRRWDWKDGVLVERWTRWSDWKPVPFAQFGTNPQGAGPLWEPVFQPASGGDRLWVPAAGGAIDEVRKEDGALIARIRPFAAADGPSIFVTGPVVAAASGVYFDAISLDLDDPWDVDAAGSWLVRIAPGGAVTRKSFADLVPDAPAANARCEIPFPASELPFPPPHSPPTVPCGSPRASVGAGPAVGPDGTVYAISRAQFDGRYGWIVATGPDLSPRWRASLRGRLSDGCNVSVPPTGGPGGCRAGAADGVDPETNRAPAAIVEDSSSAAPVPTPDGGVLYGAFTRYNFAQGHLMRFGPGGVYRNAYGFGWDTTPTVSPHDGSYSLVMKENRYDVGSYCGTAPFCPGPRALVYPDDPDAYYLTRLDPTLAPEWRYRNTNTLSCTRLPDGALRCADDHPRGFEFCVNAVAVDANGIAWANAEDGNLWAVDAAGRPRGRGFLDAAEGAAYTPVVAADGIVYAQNFGHLIAVDAAAVSGCGAVAPAGSARPPVCAAPGAPPAFVSPPR